MKPLCVDLFCGLGGWAEGFLAEGYRVVGFDIEVRPYPGQLVIQDVLTLHGSQFKDAAVIVASPPCQKYSWLAMPWSRSTIAECRRCGGHGWSKITLARCNWCSGAGKVDNSKAAKALRKEWETNGPDNRLFNACFRIQREAMVATIKTCPVCCGAPYSPGNYCQPCNGSGKTAARYIPLIVENVRGAQPWVGRSAWNFGSFHLWGDVPALMPIQRGRKNTGGSWFAVAHNTTSGHSQNPVEDLSLAGQKVGTGWFEEHKAHPLRTGNSRSSARKAASAQIAKIPFELAAHIARVYHPSRSERVA